MLFCSIVHILFKGMPFYMTVSITTVRQMAQSWKPNYVAYVIEIFNSVDDSLYISLYALF
jgi:hypothetical protein